MDKSKLKPAYPTNALQHVYSHYVKNKNKNVTIPNAVPKSKK